MKSKLKFSLITVIMLVLLGFSFQDQARGQIGLDGLFCPDVPHTTGLLETIIVGPGLVIPDFTAALIGTMEVGPNGIDVVGGLDWQHVNHQSLNTSNNPTNETGSQLVSWWTQKDSRNTYLTVSNLGGPTELHVVIFNEDCVEIRDFCDFYTPIDTHEYDFGNLVTNNGQPVTIPSGNEGFVVVTPVENCDTSGEVALDHELLAGQTVIVDQAGDYSYGINTYARQSVCYDAGPFDDGNVIKNGSFQSGGLTGPTNTEGWFRGGNGVPQVASSANWTPNQDVPPNMYDSPYTGVAVSNSTGGGYDRERCSSGCQFTGNTDNGNSVVFQRFTTQAIDGDTISGNIQMFSEDCDGAIAVALYNSALTVLHDSECWESDENTGFSFGGSSCDNLETFEEDVQLAFVDFDQNSASFDWELTIPAPGSYELQIIAVGASCNVAASVNNVFVQNRTDDDCVGYLDGRENARLDYIEPETLYAQFNVLPGNVTAGSDVVHINFADSYDPYRPTAAFSRVDISIFDEDEFPLSCGLAEVCFVRLGIDDSVENSDTFTPPTIPPPTTAPPTTAPPTTAPPTPTPTPTNNGGGSSSCAIAGSPVQLGTALANVLIPLVPVAFAFGVRAVRRRKK